MKQQFYVGDKVKRAREFDSMVGGVFGEVYEVTGVLKVDGIDCIELDNCSERSACYYNIVERGWQKNTGEQPVDDNVEVEVKRRDGGEARCPACAFRWDFEQSFNDIVEWRLADNSSSDEDEPEPIPPAHVALGDELVSPAASTEQKWTDKHYDNNYTLTRKDIERGFVKIDPYFVSKMWKIGSKDDSGALWHCFKTIARFGEKNSREREIKALYAQIKRLADIEGVDLDA